MTRTEIKASLRMRFTRYLEAKLHNRGKRLMFLASLAARLHISGQFDKVTRDKLNQVMQLSKGSASLVVPFELSKVIWHGKTAVEIFHYDPANTPLTEEVIEKMTQSAISSTPAWLRYGDNSEMAKDVSKLLHNRGLVFGF